MFDLGAKPRSIKNPIRKKAWHRAMKAGRLWALAPYSEFKNVEHSKDGTDTCLHGKKFAQVHFDSNCRMGEFFILWPWE
jgi:hypothetical protein